MRAFLQATYRLTFMSLLLFSFIILIGCRESMPMHLASMASGSRTPAIPTVDFKVFAGAWVSHGAGLTLSPDGQATYSARIYQWCGPDVTPPCDAFQGNNIISGNIQKIHFTRIAKSTAYGTIVSSTVGHVGSTVSLTKSSNDTTIFTESFLDTPRMLCGQDAPASFCGA